MELRDRTCPTVGVDVKLASDVTSLIAGYCRSPLQRANSGADSYRSRWRNARSPSTASLCRSAESGCSRRVNRDPTERSESKTGTVIALVFVPATSTWTEDAAVAEVENGMSTYSAEVEPPRQSDAFCAAVSATICPTVSWSAFALEHWLAVLVTVTTDEPDLPSLVAVIVATPDAAPVAVRTLPTNVPVATPRFDENHENVRPDSTLPLASRAVAVRTTVAPTATEAVAGVTVTDETGMVPTVRVAVPLLPSLVAVNVAIPVETPVVVRRLPT